MKYYEKNTKGGCTMKTTVKFFVVNAFILLVFFFSSCKQITEPTENTIAEKNTNIALNKATSERPFKGTMLYTITGMGDNVWYLTGTGNLTHLGNCTTVESIYFWEGRGEDTFTAADGSQINMTWYSVGEDEASATFNWTIVGGTGRFA